MKKQYIVTMVHKFSVEYTVVADSPEEAESLAYRHLEPSTYSQGSAQHILVGPDVTADYNDRVRAIFPAYRSTGEFYQGRVTEVELDDDEDQKDVEVSDGT